ncbi:MAG: lipopolysaccharide core heptose(I) kinase RfaP [Opitutales bacterium]
MHLTLHPDLKKALPEDAVVFDWFLEPRGTVHRKVKHRLTYETQLGGHHVFVKRHLASGWAEVLKEWYRFRKPVVSARTEWLGAEALAAAGVPVPAVLGKGERGRYPHAVESFVVLEALPDRETLEHFKPGWLGLEGTRWVACKRALIDEVARMTSAMHAAGINHRDLYINHFLVERSRIRDWQPGQPIRLHLIDLHRAQMRKAVPRRWLVKDLGSLVFSALDCGLTSADCARFLRTYLGPGWKTELRRQPSLWRAAMRRALRMYRSYHGRPPELPGIARL